MCTLSYVFVIIAIKKKRGPQFERVWGHGRGWMEAKEGGADVIF